MNTIIHCESRKQFEIKIDTFTAYVEYEIDGQSIDITHTYVPKELEGQGIASKLVEVTYEYGENLGLTPKATCRYAKTWLKRKLSGGK